MPRHYWLHCVAVIGFVIVSANGELHSQSNSPPAVGVQGDSQSASHAPFTEPNCEKVQSIEAANYCVQRGAAAGSESQAFWTKLQFFGGSFGLLFVAWSLFYSARATKAAVEAASQAAEQVKVARESAQRQLRAYVYVKSDCIFETIWSQDVFDEEGRRQPGEIEIHRIRATFENVGSTPTRHLVYRINEVRIVDHGTLLPNYDYADDENSRLSETVIGPNSTGTSAPFYITPEQFEAIKSGKRAFVWGWIDYNDVFDNSPRHRTEFCHQLLIKTPVGNDPPLVEFLPYGPFNGADRDCKRNPRAYEEVKQRLMPKLDYWPGIGSVAYDEHDYFPPARRSTPQS